MGWLDNMENGGSFLGTTNKGFDYNGAWGGQFQNGGSMPGSVGFSYARTKGIPYNGPGGKMTVASAQNGFSTRQKRGIELTLKDYKQEQKEKEEFVKTGGIKNARSMKYKQDKKVQPMFSQDNRTREEIAKSAETMDKVHESQLYGERPLLYLADPTKMLGDVGVRGYEGTEADRARIMMNRYNPNLTASEKLQNQFNMGLQEVPAAALNVGLSTMAVGEAGLAPSMGRVLRESFNPVPLPFNVGMKDTSTLWRNLKNDDDVAGLISENQGLFTGKYPTNNRLLDYENLNVDVPKYNPFANRIMNMDRSNDVPLPRDMEPYLSRYTPPISREEEVFQNIMGPEYIGRKFDERTIHLDRDGNVIDPPQLQDGGIIDDDRGQWAFPGEITRINSNKITMQGVPFGVLGISDTGDIKDMKPGKKYKFKGTKVTEFPKAKDGNQLTKLDQLTNFTNYNTKQPGGWLNQH